MRKRLALVGRPSRIVPQTEELLVRVRPILVIESVKDQCGEDALRSSFAKKHTVVTQLREERFGTSTFHNTCKGRLLLMHATPEKSAEEQAAQLQQTEQTNHE